MDKAPKAYDTMASRKMNCAQAVFTSFSKDFGLKDDLALSVSQGLGAGMGYNNSVCGAVTGAYMALGLAKPASEENPRVNMENTFSLMAEFNRKFKALHGSLNCTELTGYDLNKPEQVTEAREKGVFVTKCPVFVSDAVKILESLLKPS